MKKINHIIGIKTPFFPAEKEFKAIKNELIDALKEVGSRGLLILGPKVLQFEAELARLTHTKFSIGCASGTDALTLALKALYLGRDDEVIVPANSYPTIFGVTLSGVKPVLADVNNQTGNLDVMNIQKKINSHTKAVIVVHLYGQSANIEAIAKICKKEKILLIEDCAQAFGAVHDGRPVGSFGTIATFSFYPTKNLGAYGDGGAIVTNDINIFDQLKMLRMYGEKSRYMSEKLGYNSRLDELQAAFLLKKLVHMETWLTIRKKYARIYLDELSCISEITLPQHDRNGNHTYHLFAIRSNRRNDLKTWLLQKGIETGIHYPFPIHFVDTFKQLGKKGDFPNSEQWANQELSLPLHPFLSEKQIRYVAQKTREFFEIHKGSNI